MYWRVEKHTSKGFFENPAGHIMKFIELSEREAVELMQVLLITRPKPAHPRTTPKPPVVSSVVASTTHHHRVGLITRTKPAHPRTPPNLP